MSGRLPEAVVGEIRRIAGTGRLLVALDFDGVLAPFTLDPMAARMLPESRAAIERLRALPDTWVAYVSGRALASLIEVSEADETVMLAGSHGVELRLEPSAPETVLTADESAAIERLRAAMQRIADATPGSRIETKPAGVSLHVRGVPEPDASRALEAARRAVREAEDSATVRDGKLVVEVAVRSATKGDAVRRLRDEVDATAVFYAGDDVTDEDAFAVLSGPDLGIKVGPAPTAARHRVADCDDIAAVLTLLADGRAARGTAAKS